MEDHKAGTRRALANYYKNQEPKTQRKRVHNEKPEKEVEKACLAWMRGQGWTVAIYESKATYNPNAGRYISQNMKAGTADCMGHMADGVGVIVEFKAPTKLSTFAAPKNKRQQEFIEEKIAAGCFACVVDSVERLSEIYIKWSYMKQMLSVNPNTAEKFSTKGYLLSMLPKRSGRSKYDKPFSME